MGLTLAGTITVISRDYDAGTAEFLVEAGARRVGGGVKTNMAMRVIYKSADESQLEITADTTFIGRLGELGQPIIRRKARTTLEDFMKNLSKLLETKHHSHYILGCVKTTECWYKRSTLRVGFVDTKFRWFLYCPSVFFTPFGLAARAILIEARPFRLVERVCVRHRWIRR